MIYRIMKNGIDKLWIEQSEGETGWFFKTIKWQCYKEWNWGPMKYPSLGRKIVVYFDTIREAENKIFELVEHQKNKQLAALEVEVKRFPPSIPVKCES